MEDKEIADTVKQIIESEEPFKIQKDMKPADFNKQVEEFLKRIEDELENKQHLSYNEEI